MEEEEHMAAAVGPLSGWVYGWLCSCSEWKLTGENKEDAEIGAREHMEKY